MKASTKILALMVALSAGSTLAASAGTSAGSAIKNIATITYDDPATGTPVTPISSNEVTTIVSAITGFDIVYTAGSDDTTATGTLPAGYARTNVLPGDQVVTRYTVNNNSNIDNYVINITADTTGSPNTPSNIQYFLDTDKNGVADNATPITSVTLANGADVGIVQVFTVPTTANKGAVYAASPKGNAPSGTAPNSVAYGAYAEANNTPNANGDLQYTRATVYTPVLTETPSTPGNTVVPPTTGNPGLPNNPVSPPGTPGDAGDPSVPGYSDPGNPGTAIQVDVTGNVQYAYPPSGVTTVTFNNQVNNGGGLNDTVKLFPTDNTGNPIGTNNGNGTFTLTDGTVVKFLSNTGQPLTLVGGYPTVTAPANGSVTYRTEISNFPISTTDPLSTTVKVGISSGNKAATTPLVADATTTDTILPPGLQFGDVNGTTPTPGDKGPGNAPQVADPSKSVSGAPVTDAAVNTDRTAVFPMIIKNTGEYNDTYTLDNTTVTFTTTTGGTATTTVKYFYSNGTELTKNSSGQYFTNVVNANASLTVYAVVDVPTNAAATNGTTSGANPDVVFNQRATGNYSGVVLNDPNDQITVRAAGKVAVGKFTRVRTTLAADDHYVDNTTSPLSVVAGAPSSPLHIGNPVNYSAQPGASVTYGPGESYSYQVIAKNTYNTTINTFFVSDTVVNTLTVGSATCTLSTGTACTTSTTGQTVKTNSVSLPAGATITLTIPVTVK